MTLQRSWADPISYEPVWVARFWKQKGHPPRQGKRPGNAGNSLSSTGGRGVGVWVPTPLCSGPTLTLSKRGSPLSDGEHTPALQLCRVAARNPGLMLLSSQDGYSCFQAPLHPSALQPRRQRACIPPIAGEGPYLPTPFPGLRRGGLEVGGRQELRAGGELAHQPDRRAFRFVPSQWQGWLWVVWAGSGGREPGQGQQS